MMWINILVRVAFSSLSVWTLFSCQESGSITTRGAVDESSTPQAKERWSLKKYFTQNQTPCCQDLFQQYEVGYRDSDGNTVLPASCMLVGAECPAYNIYADSRLPAIPVGRDTTCIDNEGFARTSSAVDAKKIQGGVGNNLPLCTDDATNTPSLAWWLWVIGIYCFYGINAFGILYTAVLPLEYADAGYRVFETMPYIRRLAAVSSLWGFSGGGSLMFVMSEIHLVRWIWVLWGTEEGFVLAVNAAIYTYIAMRPLPYKFPTREVLNNAIFALWREYFDFKAVNEFGQVVDMDNITKDQSYLLAQLPHAVMPYGAILGSSALPELLPSVWPVSGVVATALLWTPVLRHIINYLGVREAGTLTIHQMFTDGYQAVGVVTGGIAEMFVSRRKEKLTYIRKGFAHIAIKGGHDIIPIFVFGVSLTHRVFPGFDNRFIRALSRKFKVPLMLFWGAFSLVPRRQQLRMVVGRPIAVKKVADGATNEDAQALCNEVQASVLDIYARQKPFWEKRPVGFER